MQKFFNPLFFFLITITSCAQLPTSTPNIDPPVAIEEPALVKVISTGNNYVSANGQNCQTVLLETGTELRCFDGVQWQSVPSITNK